MTVPNDPTDVTAEVVEEVYNECFKETNNDGNNFRAPDNVTDSTGDGVGVHPASGGTDQQHLDTADLGASKPVPQPEPTRKQVSEWRAANFTVRHAQVIACGHRIDLKQFPKHANCEDCWLAFFSVSPEDVASVHDLLLKEGTQGVVRAYGSKFTKQFGKFLQKKLLKEYASQEVSGIEGSVLDIKAESEGTLGIR